MGSIRNSSQTPSQAVTDKQVVMSHRSYLLLSMLGSSVPAPSIFTRDPELEKAVKALSKTLEPLNISLELHPDEESNAFVIELIDQSTGEILHQVPSVVLEHLSTALGSLRGHILNRHI